MKSIFLTLSVWAFTFHSSFSLANTCELISPEHGDILSSVRSLQAELNRIPEACRQGAAQEAFKSVEQLQGASTHLQQMWSNSSLVTTDPTGFGVSASTAISSIESIGNSIKAVANCGQLDKKSNNVVKLLSSLSDVTMSLAPVLMAATIFLPTLKGAGMLAAGAAKLASGTSVTKALTAALAVGISAKFVEVLTDMFDDDTLKMENPSDRDLVLRSICDYQRIKERADFLAPLNSGRIDYKLTMEQVRINIAKLRETYGKGKPKLREMIEKFELFKANIQGEGDKIRMAREKLYNLKNEIERSPDKNYQCLTAHNNISKGSILAGLKMPNTESGQVLLKTIRENQRVISSYLAEAQKDMVKDPRIDARVSFLTFCLSEVANWQKNVDILLSDLAAQMQEASEDGFLALQKDPAYLEWKNEFLKWRRESRGQEVDLVLLERIDGYMSASLELRNIIPESDLVIEVRGLAAKIFGQSLRKKSLAGKWLKQRLDSYDEIVSDFRKSFAQANVEVNRLALSKFFVEKKGKITQTNYSTYQNEMLDVDNRFHLENLNQHLVAGISPETARAMCTSLGQLKIQSQYAGKVLNSADYFCHFMTKNNLKEVNIDSYIIKQCWGRLGFDGDRSWAGIEQLIKGSVSKYGVNSLTGIIDEKVSILACPATRTIRFSGIGTGQIEFIEKPMDKAVNGVKP
ncbi:MAG: hypothetical protein JNL11_07815 [Bdellovibrionaceae bacterium]|nr:hypothetical protein [Pseudobdellovibrionaceae bacterium]